MTHDRWRGNGVGGIQERDEARRRMAVSHADRRIAERRATFNVVLEQARNTPDDPEAIGNLREKCAEMLGFVGISQNQMGRNAGGFTTYIRSIMTEFGFEEAER